MMMVRSELRVSPIEGVGAFAVDFIPAGTVVWKLDERFDVLLQEKDLDTLPSLMKEHFERYSWPHMVRPGILVCDIDNGRFMNHSDDANTDFTSPEQGVAKRDIHPGEEITCNYREFDTRFKGF